MAAAEEKRNRREERIYSTQTCLWELCGCLSKPFQCPDRSSGSMELLQVLHVDQMCNECGNCRSFCQYAGAPYKDKFTLFATEEDMKDSTNDGFTVLNRETKEIKLRIGGREEILKADQPSGILTEGLSELICAVIGDYGYLL